MNLVESFAFCAIVMVLGSMAVFCAVIAVVAVMDMTGDQQ